MEEFQEQLHEHKYSVFVVNGKEILGARARLPPDQWSIEYRKRMGEEYVRKALFDLANRDAEAKAAMEKVQAADGREGADTMRRIAVRGRGGVIPSRGARGGVRAQGRGRGQRVESREIE